jgi:hypothetical protein
MKAFGQQQSFKRQAPWRVIIENMIVIKPERPGHRCKYNIILYRSYNNKRYGD